MDIVDAQLHFGPGGIEQAIARMDALGIKGAVVDEFWRAEWNGYPAYKLANGVWRNTQPTAELAVMLHPDRFTTLLRVERLDPEVLHIIRIAGQSPHIRAIRVHPGMFEEENKAFGEGGYADICRACADAGLPLFVFAPLHIDAMARYAREFPSLKLCIDHCGVLANHMLRFIHWIKKEPVTHEGLLAEFDQVLALGELPNTALKCTNPAKIFGFPVYPGEGVRPIMRRAVDAFGADRVMWASDASMQAEPWAEIMFSMRSNSELSEAELVQVMGGAVRKFLDWSGEVPPREFPIEPPKAN